MATEYGGNTYNKYGQPSLDLVFTGPKKSLKNRVGNQQVEFTRDTIGTYVDENGIIKTAGENEARFDHDPATGESLGLLIEESRTNLFDQSEDLTSWTSGFFTKTNNQAISPDGTLNAASLVPNVGTTSQSSGRSVTQSAGNHVCSVFAKPNGLTILKIRFSGSSYQTILDLTGDGSIDQEVNGTASIYKYPNGWYRCVFAINDSVGETAEWQIGHNDNLNVDGINGFYIWGMQVEAGNFASSYIPTAGATDTRSADVASITGTNFSRWYNQSEGSLVVEYSDQGFPKADGGGKKIVTISSNDLTLMSSFNGYTLGNSAGANEDKVQFVWWDDDGRTYGALASTLNKAAIAYSSDPTDGLAYDGTIVTTRTNGQPKNTMIGLYFFQYQTISRLTYYSRRLSNSELQTITL